MWCALGSGPHGVVAVGAWHLKGTGMMKFVVPVVVAGGLAACAAGLAGPAAADSWEPTPPTSPFPGSSTPTDNAATVVGNLQASGYRVILTQYGAQPLAQCTVPAVTPGQAITTPQTTGAKAVYFVTLYTTVYVTVDCTKAASSSSSSSGSS